MGPAGQQGAPRATAAAVWRCRRTPPTLSPLIPFLLPLPFPFSRRPGQPGCPVRPRHQHHHRAARQLVPGVQPAGCARRLCLQACVAGVWPCMGWLAHMIAQPVTLSALSNACTIASKNVTPACSDTHSCIPAKASPLHVCLLLPTPLPRPTHLPVQLRAAATTPAKMARWTSPGHWCALQQWRLVDVEGRHQGRAGASATARWVRPPYFGTSPGSSTWPMQRCCRPTSAPSGAPMAKTTRGAPLAR